MPKLTRKLFALAAIALSFICAAAAFFGPNALPESYRVISPFLSPTGSFWALVLLFLGLFGAYYQFKAKVSLEPEPALKSESVISTPFRITNESVLPIYNIGQEWVIQKGHITLSGELFATEVEDIDARPKDTIAKLGGTESVTVYPFENVSYGWVNAKRLKLIVTISYETAIVHWHIRKYFIFEANEGVDGIHWYHSQLPKAR